MKIKYLFFLLLIFILSGCSNININKDIFIKKIDSKLNNMVTISNQELTNYYEIDITKFKDFVFKISLDEPTNIYVLVLPNSKKEAKKEIAKFFDKKLEKANSEDKKRIKNRYEKNYGDYLFYIVSNNNKEIYEEMNKFIKN